VSTPLERLDALTTQGRLGLLERATVESPESALALASVTAETARRHGGRLVWAGHVDQVFIGDDRRVDDEVLVSEFPSKMQASDALAERLEWGVPHLVRSSRLSVYRPAPAPQRAATRLFFAIQRCLGRKTPVADLSNREVLDALALDPGAPEHGPSPEALERYVSSGIEGKVVMLNLLRFKRDAVGDVAAGRAAYARYGRRAAPLIARLGGRIRARGARVIDLAEAGDPEWDALVLVQYPSRADFLGMVTSPHYTPGHVDRDAGLERTELIVCTSHATFF
jgi:uncharacterized protein (DUF1330 family)